MNIDVCSECPINAYSLYATPRFCLTKLPSRLQDQWDSHHRVFFGHERELWWMSIRTAALKGDMGKAVPSNLPGAIVLVPIWIPELWDTIFIGISNRENDIQNRLHHSCVYMYTYVYIYIYV